MSRKTFDCRELPGDCSLAISGEEEEVVRAQAQHAIATHGAQDGDELRGWILSLLRDEPTTAAPKLGTAA